VLWCTLITAVGLSPFSPARHGAGRWRAAALRPQGMPLAPLQRTMAGTMGAHSMPERALVGVALGVFVGSIFASAALAVTSIAYLVTGDYVWGGLLVLLQVGATDIGVACSSTLDRCSRVQPRAAALTPPPPTPCIPHG